jgi:hypothetical protein
MSVEYAVGPVEMSLASSRRSHATALATVPRPPEGTVLCVA